MSDATHANAALTPRGRLRLARVVIAHGWSPARSRGAVREVMANGQEVGRPLLGRGPGRADSGILAPVVRPILHLSRAQRLGPAEIGDRLGVPASTVHAVLVRRGLNRLTHLDPGTGEPVRRY